MGGITVELKNRLNELIKDLIKRKITVSDVDIINDELCYTIKGFAKSGCGILFIDGGKVKLETRYNRIDTIESLEDIVNVAYDWDWNYCQKNNTLYNVYVVQKEWLKLYTEFGKNVEIFK